MALLLISALAIPSVASAGKKEFCLAQSALAKVITKYRMDGESKEEQLATSKKVSSSGFMNDLTVIIINVVYASEPDELGMVPGMIYEKCME
jgi:hypothetical protein